MKIRSSVAPLILVLGVLSGAEAARIELYTMGKGDALFSKYGHAALCVTGNDFAGGGRCYNYGTSDFSRPVGLGWDVVRGRAEFWVSRSDLLTMLFQFEVQDRTIYRQILPLTQAQVAEMAETLARDASPDNRVYIYNHYLENCSTRPRDHIDAVTQGALRDVAIETLTSYRDYALDGFASFHWILVPLGDLFMGRWVDREIDPFEAMFVPRVLRRAVEAKFGVEPTVVYARQGPSPPPDVEGLRGKTLWVLLGAGIVLGGGILLGGPRLSRAARVGSAAVMGLVGTIMLAAALVSVLPELRRNEMLLVFLPFDFVLASRRARLYTWFRSAELLLVAVLSVSGVLIQPLGPFWIFAALILGAMAARRG